MLAALFFFGAEILLWTDPLQHTLTEWALRLVGYMALAALALDFAARYRIREMYDVLVLAGIFGLCVGLFVQPQSSLVDFPRTLMTRVMGAHALIGAQMFGVLLALTGGQVARYRRLLLGYSAWLGFYWGIWMRWSPTLTQVFTRQVELSEMFLHLAVTFGCVLLTFVLVSRRRQEGMTPLDLRLSPLGLGMTLIVLVALFVVRTATNAINLSALPPLAVLLALCFAILWFRREGKGKTLLDAHLPPTPLAWGWIAAAGAIFSAMTLLGHQLPLFNVLGFNQLSIMELAFAAGGLLWLPTVAAVFSIRAIDRQAQQLES